MSQAGKRDFMGALATRGKSVPTYMETEFLNHMVCVMDTGRWSTLINPEEREAAKAFLLKNDLFYPLLWAYSLKAAELQKEWKKQGRLKLAFRELGVIAS